MLGQQTKQFFNVNSNVVIDGTAVDGRITEVSWKQNGTCQLHNVMQCFSGGQGFTIFVLMEKPLIGQAVRKLVDGLCQYRSVIKWAHRLVDKFVIWQK